MGLSISRFIVKSHSGRLWLPTTLRTAQVFTSFYPPKSRHMIDACKSDQPAQDSRYPAAVAPEVVRGGGRERLRRAG